MSAKGSFSFRNEQILQTYIDDGVYLRLERIGLAVARVYFVNEGHAEVPVPEGFRITDHSNSDVDVPRVPNREEYVLGWTDNYSLLRGDVVIIKLLNQRRWALQGAPERAVTAVEL